ncbi:MAG TPA: HD domain-containing phosphohydrolase [Longimicrobiales bacterium]
MTGATAVRFLHAFAQAVATMALYREGHPARERAIDAADEQLRRLLESETRVFFTFLPEEVVCGSEPLRELADWDWGRRLANAGIQRLEFDSDVTRADLEGFLDEIAARLTLVAVNSAEARPMRSSRIRFGSVGLQGEEQLIEVPEQILSEPRPFGYTLTEEADTLRWLHEEVQTRQQLHIAEAEAVVRSLAVAMHGEREMLIPLLQLKQFDEYTTTHALNVAVLAMALTEFLGLSAHDVRTFGVAGLLHDIGKVRIPHDILTKPGKLTAEEREIINSHTVEGARIIVQTQLHLDLAAVVAYEHHIMIDGGGYPALRYRRDCHYASRIVHVCDVYDALRTRRPYRDAWEADRVLDYVAERAGTEFDPIVADAFIRMMRKWETRVARVTEAGEVVRAEAGSPAAPRGE